MTIKQSYECKLLLSICDLYRNATFIDKLLFFLLNLYDKYYGFSRIFFYSWILYDRLKIYMTPRSWFISIENFWILSWLAHLCIYIIFLLFFCQLPGIRWRCMIRRNIFFSQKWLCKKCAYFQRKSSLKKLKIKHEK